MYKHSCIKHGLIILVLTDYMLACLSNQKPKQTLLFFLTLIYRQILSCLLVAKHISGYFIYCFLHTSSIASKEQPTLIVNSDKLCAVIMYSKLRLTFKCCLPMHAFSVSGESGSLRATRGYQYYLDFVCLRKHFILFHPLQYTDKERKK